MNHRLKTKKIKIGKVKIGGGEPIAVQSMTKTYTADIKSTIKQIKSLESIGCEIIRLAIPDEKSARAIKIFKRYTDVPLVADIHFNYKLALLSIENDIDKVRINPSNIGSRENIKEIIKLAKQKNIPIRLGFNSGSFKFKTDNRPKEMVDSAIDLMKFCEDNGFTNLVFSLKFSDVSSTVTAYRLISQLMLYPLHIGITEAGSLIPATVKSTIGITELLKEGIGDTIRVSITGPAEDEVRVGYEILYSLGLRERTVEIISCPTCGRCKFNLLKLVNDFETKISKLKPLLKKPIKVAIMGCVVNGPGEAKEADIGIAGGKKFGILFQKGNPIRKVRQDLLLNNLIKRIKTEFT